MEVLIKLSDAIKTLKSMAVPLVRKLPSAQPERLTDYSFEESCTECPAYDTENHRCPRFNQVIRTALKDANLEPCENCISRQAAIDALEDYLDEYSGLDEEGYHGEKWCAMAEAKMVIENLPSAQPEITRCKDCKNWDTTWTNDFSPNYHYCPMVDGARKEDWYCADAERRTDANNNLHV